MDYWYDFIDFKDLIFFFGDIIGKVSERKMWLNNKDFILKL